MADVATVFHWPRGDLEDLDAEELFEWRERAAKRLPRQSSNR